VGLSSGISNEELNLGAAFGGILGIVIVGTITWAALFITFNIGMLSRKNRVIAMSTANEEVKQWGTGTESRSVAAQS
jgi:hypothetical protein